MSAWKKLVDGLTDIAPTLVGAAGTAAGGPVVGAALAAVARRMAGAGDSADLESVAETILADPNKLMEFRLEAQRINADLEKAHLAADTQGAKDTTDRTLAYEGTAADIKDIRFFGPLMLFLRGSQRITWGYGVLFFDWRWFSTWRDMTAEQEATLWLVNFLVLGFLFGERAVKNVAPMITDLLNARKLNT